MPSICILQKILQCSCKNVSKNIRADRGDVDSIAALALGLVGGSAGLRFGEEGGLAWELLEGLEGAEYLASVARRFSAWVGAQ